MVKRPRVPAETPNAKKRAVNCKQPVTIISRRLVIRCNLRHVRLQTAAPPPLNSRVQYARAGINTTRLPLRIRHSRLHFPQLVRFTASHGIGAMPSIQRRRLISFIHGALDSIVVVPPTLRSRMVPWITTKMTQIEAKTHRFRCGGEHRDQLESTTAIYHSSMPEVSLK
ncbi:unnamed protein product [Lathyrus oleraceus]|uniref:uncharacterized protein LOC127126539 n=1 Tax=Pisum sativum TaxID=3888 RepID=UPI001FC55F73|nr:uncharacterized protein LOC127126539 [Pisum sativum]